MAEEGPAADSSESLEPHPSLRSVRSGGWAFGGGRRARALGESKATSSAAACRAISGSECFIQPMHAACMTVLTLSSHFDANDEGTADASTVDLIR